MRKFIKKYPGRKIKYKYGLDKNKISILFSVYDSYTTLFFDKYYNVDLAKSINYNQYLDGYKMKIANVCFVDRPYTYIFYVDINNKKVGWLLRLPRNISVDNTNGLFISTSFYNNNEEIYSSDSPFIHNLYKHLQREIQNHRHNAFSLPFDIDYPYMIFYWQITHPIYKIYQIHVKCTHNDITGKNRIIT